jgi:hypothetical protein
MTIPRRPYRLLLNRHAGVPGVVVLPEGGFRRRHRDDKENRDLGVGQPLKSADRYQSQIGRIQKQLE